MLDKLTYAGREENLADLREQPGSLRPRGDRGRRGGAAAVAAADAVVNFAAETHVDRSIAEPDAFITTHAVGTFVLLEAARRAAGRRYVQVSTDQVYGSIEAGSFTESPRSRPRRPTPPRGGRGPARRLGYHHTYGLAALICRGSNNYGPFQYPEKLIPLMILNALHGDPLPVYGDGQQVRNWIFARGLRPQIGYYVLAHGAPGETYNVGGPDEAVNLDVVRRIIGLTGAPRRTSSSTSRTGRATIAATPSARRRCARWAGRRGCASTRA